MLETKRDEIERLNEHASLREDGLICSENMLESDTKSFLKFFSEIKDKTNKASKELEDKRRKKQDQSNKLREVTEKIQVMQSNISKNVELLEQFNNYKKFLDSLATPMAIEARRQKDAIKRAKYEEKDKKKTEHDK